MHRSLHSPGRHPVGLRRIGRSAKDQAAREFQECAECPVMIGVPAGSFVMGSPAKEPGHFDAEGPQHSISIKAFALGKYDVSSKEFLTFLRETGYQPTSCNPTLGMRWHSPGGGRASPPFDADPPHWPAVCLDWHAAQRYVDWLNAKVRAARPETARVHGPYRLPTEAEWEYAARAGTATARWWGDDIGVGNANCNGWVVLGTIACLRTSTADRIFGLYGMLGNAWQWTADCWHPSYVGAPKDGSAWTEDHCLRHVIRGGSWNSLPVYVRSAARSSSGMDDEDLISPPYRLSRRPRSSLSDATKRRDQRNASSGSRYSTTSISSW
ncbi:MAG: formylglycine-generating enzyme family protein [Hyphomicrobiales bacterium]